MDAELDLNYQKGDSSHGAAHLPQIQTIFLFAYENATTPRTMPRFRKAFALAEELRSTSTFISCIPPAKSKSSFNRNAEISLYPKEEL